MMVYHMTQEEHGMHKKIERVIHRILHVLEFLIAALTLIVLVGMLGLEIYKMFTQPNYFSIRPD